MIGKRFGKLTVERFVGRNKHRKLIWNCKCDCGSYTDVDGGSLRTGKTKSCGCLIKDVYRNKACKKMLDQVFGRLTVKALIGISKHKKYIWLCRCECGTYTSTTTSALQYGRTKSCGCLRKEKSAENMRKSSKGRIQRLPLEGQRFGRLVVLKYIGNDEQSRPLWLCKCDCGKEIISKTGYLKAGHTKSCGCIRGEFKKKKLIGTKFGRLLIIEEIPREHRKFDKKVEWLCKCDCGKEVSVISDSLLSGRTKSCGCLHDELAAQRFLEASKNWCGENHHNWKGGVSPLYDEIRRFLKKIKWRESVLKKYNYTCVRCGNTHSVSLCAHHLIQLKFIVEEYNITTLEEAMQCLLLLSVDNGVVLCPVCHAWVHSNKNIYSEFILPIESQKRIMSGFIPKAWLRRKSLVQKY